MPKINALNIIFMLSISIVTPSYAQETQVEAHDELTGMASALNWVSENKLYIAGAASAAYVTKLLVNCLIHVRPAGGLPGVRLPELRDGHYAAVDLDFDLDDDSSDDSANRNPFQPRPAFFLGSNPGGSAAAGAPLVIPRLDLSNMQEASEELQTAEPVEQSERSKTWDSAIEFNKALRNMMRRRDGIESDTNYIKARKRLDEALEALNRADFLTADILLGDVADALEELL